MIRMALRPSTSISGWAGDDDGRFPCPPHQDQHLAMKVAVTLLAPQPQPLASRGLTIPTTVETTSTIIPIASCLVERP